MATMKTALANSKVRNALLALYILVILGFSASARAGMAAMPVMTGSAATQMKTLVGEVAMTLEGQAYLVVSDDVFFELKSHEDLSVFNGVKVQIQGYELLHKVGPVYQLASWDPLSNDANEQASAPVLVVLQINALY